MSEPLIADLPYKLYEYVQNTDIFFDDQIVPHSINYKTGLEIKPFPQRTFVLGEMTEVTFYADFDGTTYSNPIVRETFTYNRDATSKLANYRDQTIEWYLNDGTIGPHSKNVKKFYITMAEKRDEVARKRHNQVSRCAEVIIYLLIVQEGMDQLSAVTAGQTYWASLVQEIADYEQGSTQNLKDRINTDTDPTWVPNIKTAALMELV